MYRYASIFSVVILFISSCTQNSISGAEGVLEQAVSPDGLSFFVAPDGNDDDRGTLTEPFETLRHARDAVRKVKKAGAKPVTVYLREGVYHLSRPVTFTEDDSGSSDAPVTYKAYPGERPVVSGGFKLNLKWRTYKDGIMMANVPGQIDEIDQLFVNGKRQNMARYPNFDSTERFFGGTSADAIAPARVKTWSNPAGGYIHALHKSMWGSKHYRITGVDTEGKLKLHGGWQENRGGGFDDYFRGGYHNKYLFVENIFELLDAPGEWYFDRKSSILYLKPFDEVDLFNAEVIGAGLKQLFIAKGSTQKPVCNIRFQGLTFKHTKRIFMDPYERLLRGDWSIARLAAVHFEGAENCSVEDCFFEDLGGNGVFISRYNRQVNVIGCRFTRLCESCVCLVGDYGAVRSGAVEYSRTLPQDRIDLTPGPITPDYPAHCRIHNNLMHRFGIIGKQVAGVFVSMSQQITVSHNTIYQCPRAAICINDGCWGGHIIEYNDAFNTVAESGDHGPFNSWGRDRWWKTSYNGGRDIEPFAKERSLLDNYKVTHIRNNRFAHPGGHSWGIDLDDGSSNYHVYNNLCLGLGVKLREGFFRRIENNIIINGFGGFHIWMPGSDDVISRNIFISDKPYQFIRANPQYAKEFDYNIFYSDKGMPTITGVGKSMTLKQWQEKGFDRHSVFADPLFVDADNGNYQVKTQSPALQLGFKNFDMNKFGVIKPAFQFEASKESRHFKPAPTEAESVSVRSPHLVPWLGATIKNLIGEAEKSAAGLGAETGILFMEVPADSEAAKSGFQTGDVLLKIAGETVHSIRDFNRLLKRYSGRNVRVVVFNATERTFRLTLQK
ncbi:MAG: PDZ domain-containing protein [Planctomycetes bacterium]|nr:PDZ domain-containing protein [Planctomycetota bacterium]